ncbi:MAG: thiopurine S-methyltransferase [Gallionella sp.]
MQNDFWLERWKQEKIGFHQNGINPYLCEYWQELHLARDSLIFVPLCGKSRDLLWLRQQGHPVVGVELSDVAVQAFFQENGYAPKQITRGKFGCYKAHGIHILCGDFFEMNKEDLSSRGKVNATYDRAALIALPQEMRERYVRHLISILPPATQILLITLDYLQTEMQGPPFSVSADEVAALYGEHAEVHLLAQLDVLAQNPRFQQRGLSRLQENVFLLKLH